MPLQCDAVGPPAPVVYWSKGSVSFGNDTQGILRLTNATHDDSGLYHCHAVNYMGHSVKKVKIRKAGTLNCYG